LINLYGFFIPLIITIKKPSCHISKQPGCALIISATVLAFPHLPLRSFGRNNFGRNKKIYKYHFSTQVACHISAPYLFSCISAFQIAYYITLSCDFRHFIAAHSVSSVVHGIVHYHPLLCFMAFIGVIIENSCHFCN
jgi:hypothetical protein